MGEKIGHEAWSFHPLLVERPSVLQIPPFAPLYGWSIVEPVLRAAADWSGQSANTGGGSCSQYLGEVRTPGQMVPKSSQPRPAMRTTGEVTEKRVLLAREEAQRLF